MNRHVYRHARRIPAAAAVFLLLAAAPARAYEYPTIDRVEYVRACQLENQGPEQEMIYKCSCVIDAIARKLSYDDYVEDSTAAKAFTIAGERGQALRSAPGVKEEGNRFKALQNEAKLGCFIK